VTTKHLTTTSTESTTRQRSLSDSEQIYSQQIIKGGIIMQTSNTIITAIDKLFLLRNLAVNYVILCE